MWGGVRDTTVVADSKYIIFGSANKKIFFWKRVMFSGFKFYRYGVNRLFKFNVLLPVIDSQFKK